MPRITKLFEPIRVGGVELKNRIVLLAITTGLAEKYKITEGLVNFYEARAKGGAGLVTIGTVFPSDFSSTQAVYQPTMEAVGIWSDDFIHGLRNLTDRLHRYGAKVAAQVMLCYEWRPNSRAPLEAVGPSAGIRIPGFNSVRELTLDDIHQIITEFGDGVRRAREAGFDMVELHAGIGYFISRFLSPYSNKRNDEYGGSPEKRMRFLLDIIDSAKKKAGSGYTLICRLSGDQFMDGGYTIEDTKKMVPILEKAGIAAFNIQAGWHECPRPLIQQCVPAGAFVYLATEVKRVTNLPVATAYRINDPILAEEILAGGKADLIGMARALLADPYLPVKAREGRFEDIRPCIACCRCIDMIIQKQGFACSTNAQAGREAEYAIKPSQQPKRVFVIGGGPAGMEAASVAAQRGNVVTLFDRGSRLGGQLLQAAIPPFKTEIAEFNNFLNRQVKKSNVKVKLGQEVSGKSIMAAKPDVVIVATGARAIIPSIVGVNGHNVVRALEVLTEAKKVGQKIVIIGGGLIGCETAEFLAQKGKKVVIVEMLGRMGADMGITTRWVVLRRLKKAGVRVETGAKAEEITASGVRVNRGGAIESIEADTVVYAVGFEADRRLAEELKGKVPLYTIGDCVDPRRIMEAIASGFEIGNNI